MDYNELLNHLQVVGKDPSRLIFEDELTGLYNLARFLHNYFQQNIPWNALEHNPLSLLMMDLDYFKRINEAMARRRDQALLASELASGSFRRQVSPIGMQATSS